MENSCFTVFEYFIVLFSIYYEGGGQQIGNRILTFYLGKLSETENV